MEAKMGKVRRKIRKRSDPLRRQQHPHLQLLLHPLLVVCPSLLHSFDPSGGTQVFSGADSAALSQSLSSHPSTISPGLTSQLTETDLQLANQTTIAGKQLLNQAAVAVAGVGVSDYSGSTRANDDEFISKEEKQSLYKAKRKRRPRKHKEVQT